MQLYSKSQPHLVKVQPGNSGLSQPCISGVRCTCVGTHHTPLTVDLDGDKMMVSVPCLQISHLENPRYIQAILSILIGTAYIPDAAYELGASEFVAFFVCGSHDF